MRKLSLEKGMLILLVGLVGASCTKDVQEPFETTPAITIPASPAEAPADSTTAPAPDNTTAPAAPAPAAAEEPAAAPAPEAPAPAPAAPAPATATPTPAPTTPTPAPTAPAPAPTTTTTTTTPTASASVSAIGTPIGYAAVNGMTTGGQGGKTVTVSTLSALKSAAGSSEPMIIKVSGTIKGTSSVTVKSNKTIIGLSGATLDGPGLMLTTVSNVIIKNLRIINTVASDAIQIRTKSHHIWVDHCTLQNPKFDGLLDITNQSDYVTVSWTRMENASKNSLVGSSDASTADKGKLHVTYHHNFFLNNFERSPSFRFGTGHVFNNYFQNTRTFTNGYSIGARMGAVINAENNYFDGIKGAPIATIGPEYGFVSGEKTNVYNNCAPNKIRTSASTWKPTYSYKSALIAAANVPAAVKAGAGAQ